MTRLSAFLSIVLMALCLMLCGVSDVFAQTSQVLSDASKPQWTKSPDEATLFNGAPILTSYKGEIFKKTAVTNGVPSGTPDYTVNLGKPVADGSGVESGPLLKPLVAPNVDWVMFVSAVGPGGVSSRLATGPFGWPSVPQPAAGTAVTITP